MKTRSIVLALVSAGVLASGAANAINWNPGAWFGKPQANQVTLAPPPATAATSPSAAAPIAPITAPNYRGIVERYGPAVVGINTEGTAKASLRDRTGMEDDPFFQFFGIPGPGRRAPRADVPVHGQGSGFIIGKDGLILTNAHVVQDMDEVTVKLNDRREYKAKVLGSDRATDIAVLKIDAHNLPVVSLGNPGQLGVGDYVLAIGAPFGFEQSATAGIVSAVGRSLPGDAYVPFIQTDVAVNPGNSGGPLFDAAGNVVGINSQIYSQTGGYMGVSFAIPIDVALHVKDQIVQTGKATHARLGVTIQDLNQTLANSFKLPQPDGALVSSIVPGSPAERAGLQAGDVVLSYNGKAIGRSGDLPALVGMSRPGDKVSLQVWRAGKKVDLSATLSEAQDKVAAADDNGVDAGKGKLGVAVRPLSPEEKRDTQLASGVVVEQVSGAAARAGIESGDVIISVNGTLVKSVEQLRSLVKQESKHVALLVQRGEARIFIPVALG